MSERGEPVDLGIRGLEEAVAIGRGGFAVVYRAQQPAFRRTVAVKILTARLDEDGRRRFERECQAIGSLSGHPAIVTVHDSGFTAGGRPYLVMAYLPGGSLDDRLSRRGPLTWPAVTQLGVRIAGALETAHRAHIIHRDVKPANVLMSNYGVQLGDFGIATVGSPETQTGVVTATLHYAAPEVLNGARPTAASDVYSLGATLFAALTGRPAFVHDTDESIMPMLVRVQADPVPALPASVPPELDHVVRTAMAKHPAARFPDAASMGRALQVCERQHGVAVTELVVAGAPLRAEAPARPPAITRPARPVVAPSGAAATPTPAAGSVAVPPPTPVAGARTARARTRRVVGPIRRRRWPGRLIALVGLAVAGVVVWQLVERNRDPAAASTTVDAAAAGADPADRLATYAANDAPTVLGLAESWVPQVASAGIGLEAGGVTYDGERILADHERLRERYGAVLLNTSFAGFVFQNANFWITVVPQSYPDAAGALAWCTDQDLGRDDCFAKLLTTDTALTPAQTTEYQP